MKQIPRSLSERPDVLAVRPISTHPEDHYLWVVLRNLKNPGDRDNFVTHTFNVTLAKGSGGFFAGHYFGEDRDRAFRDFCDRQTNFKRLVVLKRTSIGEYTLRPVTTYEQARILARQTAEEAGMTEVDFDVRDWNAEDDVEVTIEVIRC